MRAYSSAPWPRADFSAAYRKHTRRGAAARRRRQSKIILVETVGVGQGEIEIVRLADCTIVVLMPGMGDDMQNLKAGLMEIADIFVLNKSDREGADRFEQQLKAMLPWCPDATAGSRRSCAPWPRKIKASAELGTPDRNSAKHFERAHERQRREIEHWKKWILQLLETRLIERVAGASPADEAQSTQLAHGSGRTTANRSLRRRERNPRQERTAKPEAGDSLKLGDLEVHLSMEAISGSTAAPCSA